MTDNILVCFYNDKTCNKCGKKGHKSAERAEEITESDKPDSTLKKNRWKCVTVDILNKEVNLQLDYASDLSIINIK